MSYHSKLPEIKECNERYKKHVEGLDLPPNEMDALIDIVRSILSYFVDQAFGVQTDQITLGSVGRISSTAPLGDATLAHHPDNQTAHARIDGVDSAFNPLGASEP